MRVSASEDAAGAAQPPLRTSNMLRNEKIIKWWTRFVKLVLFFLNLILVILSLAVVGLGIAILSGLVRPAVDLSEYQQWSCAPWVLLGVGAATLVVACFGCCGVVTDRYWLLVTYTIFLAVILIVQLAISGVMFNHADAMHDVIEEVMDTTFNNSRIALSDAVKQEAVTKFHDIQRKLECCGKSGPTDYHVTGSTDMPDTCCPLADNKDDTTNGTCTSMKAYEVGCTERTAALYLQWNKTMANVVIGVVCVVGALFVLLFILFIPFAELSVGRVPLPDRTLNASRQVEDRYVYF